MSKLFIQYVNENQSIKTKEYEYTSVDGVVNFTVDSINETFFILGVFMGGKRCFGVELQNTQNNDMIAFINSELNDISLIPVFAFCQPLSVLEFSFSNVSSSINFPNPQNVRVTNFEDAVNVVEVSTVANTVSVKVQKDPDTDGITGAVSDRYDTEELKYLKAFFINYYGSLDGIWIEPFFINQKSGDFPFYSSPDSSIFGRLVGANVVYTDKRFSDSPIINRSIDVDGRTPLFISNILPLEGSSGYTFFGYKITKDGWS